MPSSVIRAFDYDAGERALDVTFVTGRHYRYHAVPPRIVEGMRSATSKGRYFNARIRDHFAFTPLDESDD
ncbi:KTSC domain-containing protein [Sphingomonas sp. JC676]|uniref:KTSC domain-containing protein n=1 Tax=Sphingomonas sp. JC676 TaxID=2768065 RepID=UPI00165833A6|nr:KTSC domain-containing protein [Sphingomonas sp. JC676]MBC9032027.1 KTSC domain-containing protein [Sphingomonas sp. JC676]